VLDGFSLERYQRIADQLVSRVVELPPPNVTGLRTQLDRRLAV
jgi:hypothetical protein